MNSNAVLGKTRKKSVQIQSLRGTVALPLWVCSCSTCQPLHSSAHACRLIQYGVVFDAPGSIQSLCAQRHCSLSQSPTQPIANSPTVFPPLCPSLLGCAAPSVLHHGATSAHAAQRGTAHGGSSTHCSSKRGENTPGHQHQRDTWPQLGGQNTAGTDPGTCESMRLMLEAVLAVCCSALPNQAKLTV